jgi:antitoxin (DNA-binding transcriptional repressor) of toxin-antitoxin stability system
MERLDLRIICASRYPYSYRSGFIDLVQDLVYITLMQVNIHEAKTRFSVLVERALAGERVIIARNGTALLSLEPIKERSKPRTPGLSAGKGSIAEDFDDELSEELLREFE